MDEGEQPLRGKGKTRTRKPRYPAGKRPCVYKQGTPKQNMIEKDMYGHFTLQDPWMVRFARFFNDIDREISATTIQHQKRVAAML